MYVIQDKIKSCRVFKWGVCLYCLQTSSLQMRHPAVEQQASRSTWNTTSQEAFTSQPDLSFSGRLRFDHLTLCRVLTRISKSLSRIYSDESFFFPLLALAVITSDCCMYLEISCWKPVFTLYEKRHIWGIMLLQIAEYKGFVWHNLYFFHLDIRAAKLIEILWKSHFQKKENCGAMSYKTSLVSLVQNPNKRHIIVILISVCGGDEKWVALYFTVY